MGRWIMSCTADDGFETAPFEINEDNDAFVTASEQMARHTLGAHDGDASATFSMARVTDDGR